VSLREVGSLAVRYSGGLGTAEWWRACGRGVASCRAGAVRARLCTRLVTAAL